MRCNLPPKEYFLEKPIPEMEKYIIKDLIGTGNNAHVFKAYADDLRHTIACKVIPKSNLYFDKSGEPAWKDEVRNANILNTPIVVNVVNIVDWLDDSHGIDCIALCVDYVDGINLAKYIASNKDSIPISFVEDFIKAMFSFFYEMSQHGVTHGDMHSKNIIVEDRASQLGGQDYAFRVTDFGVASATSASRVRDDYHLLAEDLNSLMRHIDYQSANARDRFAFHILNNELLARILTERDTTREPLARQPDMLYEYTDNIDAMFADRQVNSSSTKLITPFDYLSCEQIGESHSLLKSLYSDRFLGLTEIRSTRNNLMLTGPRGCGKSTVFKSMSLKHRVLVNDATADSIDNIGVYYRCDDLYWAFPRYNVPDRTEAYDIPVHYLTATLLCELLESIMLWGTYTFKKELQEKDSILAKELWEVLDLRKPDDPSANTLRGICFYLEKERRRAKEKQRFAQDNKQPMRNFLGPDMLPKACAKVQKTLSYLQKRPIFFYIDDYSAPKITFDLQRNLNRLLMQRTSECFFKLSTESPVSFARSDIDGKEYVEGREYNMLNLGLAYLAATKKEKLAFLEDVFKRRFDAIENYPASSLEELIGSYNAPTYNDQAVLIRAGKRPEMWGKETLAELCSGDIFYIIKLVGNMVDTAGGIDAVSAVKANPLVASTKQLQAIRREAGSFLTNLGNIKIGSHLVAVVTAFGNVSYWMVKNKDSKNEEGDPPHQASKVEPLAAFTLSNRVKEVYNELLRYSVFIEDPRGKSRRGDVVPRLYLRRSLIPHFNLTFSKRDSVEMEPYEVVEWLEDPKEFERKFKRKKDNTGDKTSDLFASS